MFVVTVYPHSDSATPFKVNFNDYDEMNSYCVSLENKKCEFFVMEFPNENWGTLD